MRKRNVIKKILSMLVVLSLVISQNVDLFSAKAESNRYEAENAVLSGGAAIENDHSGYSGSGFAGGFTDGSKGSASAEFKVSADIDGIYSLSLCYANGTGSTRTLSLLVDREYYGQIRLNTSDGWDSWNIVSTEIELNAGSHEITYLYGSNDSGNVNLDYITLSLTADAASVINCDASEAVLFSGAVLENDHSGYTGSGFSGGFTDANAGNAAAEFSFNVNKNGLYSAAVRYANGTDSTRTLSMYIDNNYYGQIYLEPTGSWDSWSEIYAEDNFTAGTHYVKLMYGSSDSGNVNIDRVRLLLLKEIETPEQTTKDDEIKIPETTKAPDATKTPDTTKAPETTKAPVDVCQTVHIEAEDFASQAGVGISGTIYENSQVVNGIGKGDSMTYNVTLQGTGNYRVDVRAARQYAGVSVLEVYVDGRIATTVDISSTGLWKNFATFSSEDIYLTKGTHEVTLKAAAGGYNINWFEFAGSAPVEDTTASGEDADAKLHIEAEDYENAASVGISATKDQNSAVVNGVDKNDAMVYTVNVPVSGSYTFSIRASRVDAAAGTISIRENGKILGKAEIGKTGAWSKFEEFTGDSFCLSAGTHTLTLYADSGRYNLNWFELEHKAGGEPSPETTEAPKTTEGSQDPSSNNIHIEAEDYVKMSGVSFSAKKDQDSVVVNSVDAGDYMDYTVKVPVTGTYRFDVRASRQYAGSSILSLMQGGNVIGQCSIGSTGSWSIYKEFTGGEVHLTAGTHTLRVYATGGKYNLNWYEFKFIKADEEQTTEADTQTEEATGDNDVEFGTESDTKAPETTQIPTTSAVYGYPDMVVTDINWTPADIEEGNQVIFSAVIKNQGTGVADAGLINGVLFMIDGNSAAWSDDNTTQIYPGQSVTVTANSGPNGISAWNAVSGSHTVTAWVNDIGRYEESNTENNKYSETINVSAKQSTTEADTTVATTETQTGNLIEGVYYISNQWKGSYLYEYYSRVAYGDSRSDDSYKWAVVRDGEYYLIWNIKTGNSMTAEMVSNVNSSVSTARNDDAAAHWIISEASTSGYYVLYNALHPAWMINIEGQTGYAQCYDNVQASWGSPQWKLERIGNVPERPEPPKEEEGSEPDPSGYGASLSYIEYEAEDADTNASVLSKSTAYHIVQSEASGRKAVKLSNTGDYVEFTLEKAANTIVVRYCMPDSPDGTGIDRTLSLYVNGSHSQDLSLTSSYAWLYGEYPYTNNVSQGGEHRFFDETRVWLSAGTVPQGTKIRLQKDAGDTAGYYVIDIIDAELVGNEISRPDGYLSVTDYGAAANDGNDDYNAFVSCIAAAKAQGKGVWIPAGTFNLHEKRVIDVSGVKIQGAGMWYTTLYGAGAAFKVSGTCEFHDFAMTGVSKVRNDDGDLAGIEGYENSSNVVIQNIWMEHMKVGIWFYNTTNLTVTGCRIRNTYADGINLCSNVYYASVYNNHFRNTGDDSIAIWPWKADSCYNTIRNNTVQLPMLANCIAVYGGAGNTVKNNALYDTVAFGGGINVSTNFETPNGFSGTTTVADNLLVRTSSYDWDNSYERGSVWIFASKKDINAEVNITGNVIYDSTYTGITIEGPCSISGLTFNGNQFLNAGNTYATGSYGILVRPNARGSVNLSNNTFGATYQERLHNTSASFIVNEY